MSEQATHDARLKRFAEMAALDQAEIMRLRAEAPKLNDATVGRFVRLFRQGAGMTQAELAEAIGCPRPAVSLIESGQRHLTVVEAARAVGVWLYEDDERKR